VTMAQARGSARNISHIEVIARLALLREGRVLLCRSVKHGYMYLPGGHVEVGESAAAAAEREILEELGASVRADELALISEGCFYAGKRAHHEVNLVFRAERPDRWPRALTAPKSLEKGIEFLWVDLAAVTDLDIRPQAVKAWLAAEMGEGAVEWVSEIK
jgi:8-oxo-dGTP diphosphatase